MKKIALLALTLALVGCGSPMTVPATAVPAEVGTAPVVCCVYYEAASEWATCWGCGAVVYCVGVPCIEGVPSCQEGAPRDTGQGAASYPEGGVACLE